MSCGFHSSNRSIQSRHKIVIACVSLIVLLNRNVHAFTSSGQPSFVDNRHFSRRVLARSTSLPRHDSSISTTDINDRVESADGLKDGTEKQFLIHWKGEGVDGYSHQFREIEFRGALAAVMATEKSKDCGDFEVSWTDALEYSGCEDLPSIKLNQFRSGMQFLSVGSTVSTEELIKTVERCSLVHSLYEVVVTVTPPSGSKDDKYATLVEEAVRKEAFHDLYKGGCNEQSTWALRVRYYGVQELSERVKRELRYSSRARSMKLERNALKALTPVLIKFGGDVDLQDPDCKITIFDGLIGDCQVLGRRLAHGPKISVINPNTRICVTNTPLTPMASFCLNNVAQVRDRFSVLDPYCGSGAILLAASMVAPGCRTVGIEIAHNGLVNRDDILEDFRTRSLVPPRNLIHGDSTDPAVLSEALSAINNEPFDAIVTDPPYGIRESSNYNELTPAEQLFRSLKAGREKGRTLLRAGGRLVLFVPCQEEENIEELLPTAAQTNEAGLKFELMKEQPLNDLLSRWLVSYTCVE